MTTHTLAVSAERQVLSGIQAEPLASYLAGLGLIRLIGQVDQSSARKRLFFNNIPFHFLASVPAVALP